MPKAMHLLRKGQTRSNGRGQPKAAPVKAYAPGYFTELVRQHNWPPMWQPAELACAALRGRPRNRFTSEQAAGIREQGKGWGNGTIVMPGTPKWLPPSGLRRLLG